MTELERKEREYSYYINEHLSNVKLAYAKYGRRLCDELNVNIFILEENIYRHDQSKYTDKEFDAYRNWFYPCSDEERNKELFDEAWKHHYLNNPHHPEYWVRDNYIEDMPPVYIAEMLIDWEAMSMKFKDDTYEYYKKERDKKPFSENTKIILDRIVKDIFDKNH